SRGRLFVVVFFPSGRRHTKSKRDWSSDVCSSDLVLYVALSFKRDAPATIAVLSSPGPGSLEAESNIEHCGKRRKRIPLQRVAAKIGRASCRERVKIAELDGATIRKAL